MARKPKKKQDAGKSTDKASTKLNISSAAKKLLGNPVTRAKKAQFLSVYAALKNVRLAALQAGIDRGTYYLWLEKDEVFAQEIEYAAADFTDRLEAEADRRGQRGIERIAHFYRGAPAMNPDTKKPYMVTEYSDRLLEMRLKAELPQKYRENIDLNAKVSGGVLVVPAAPTPDDWDREAKAQQDALIRNKAKLAQ
jgi:hypothetical protein